MSSKSETLHTVGFTMDLNYTSVIQPLAETTTMNVSMVTTTTGVVPITPTQAPTTATPPDVTTLDLSVTTAVIDAIFPHVAWRVFEVLHGLLTAVALLVNFLSLGVIYGVLARLTPPLQVLTSLSFVDMLAPWAVMTAYFPTSTCQAEIHAGLMLLAHNAGALSLLTYALIHSVATYRPLQYEKIVTRRRLWVGVAVVWVVSVVTAHLHFLAVFLHQDPELEYCVQVRSHYSLALIMTAAILATTVLITALVYGRMFLLLRPIEALAGPQNEPRQSTKGVVTGMLLMAAFLLGWGPYLIAKLESIRQEPHLHPNLMIGLATSQVFVLLMCIVHPIIYGYRMINIYSGYHKMFQRCRGWFVTSWTRVRNKTDGDHDQPSTPLNPIESIC